MYFANINLTRSQEHLLVLRWISCSYQKVREVIKSLPASTAMEKREKKTEMSWLWHYKWSQLSPETKNCYKPLFLKNARMIGSLSCKIPSGLLLPFLFSVGFSDCKILNSYQAFKIEWCTSVDTEENKIHIQTAKQVPHF